MDGNVVMREDGSGIDLDNSSREVIIKDKQTGKLDYIPVEDLASTDQPINLEQLKAENAEAIRQTKSAGAG